MGTASPGVSESFKCPLQSLINDPIHSPLPSFVSATEKCLPRAILHFLLLFSVFLKKKKKVGFETRGLGSALRKSRSVQNSFAPRCPSVISFFFFLNPRAGEEKLRDMFETRGFSNREPAVREPAREWRCWSPSRALRAAPKLTSGAARGILRA